MTVMRSKAVRNYLNEKTKGRLSGRDVRSDEHSTATEVEMSKPKTITLREHADILNRMEMDWGRENLRKIALQHAVTTRREHEVAKAVVESAKVFETYLEGKKR